MICKYQYYFFIYVNIINVQQKYIFFDIQLLKIKIKKFQKNAWHYTLLVLHYNCNQINGLQNTTTLFRGYILWLSTPTPKRAVAGLLPPTIGKVHALKMSTETQAYSNIAHITIVTKSIAKIHKQETSGLHPTTPNSLLLHGIQSTSTKTPAKFCLAVTLKPHTTSMILWDNHRGRNSGPIFFLLVFWYLNIIIIYFNMCISKIYLIVQ